MELSIEQINEFNENGFLFVENLFSKDEISELKNRLPDIMNERSEKVLRERSSDSVRSAISPHLSDELFRRLSLHPRYWVARYIFTNLKSMLRKPMMGKYGIGIRIIVLGMKMMACLNLQF